MKIKSVLASIAACAIAVSAMAVPAFAEKTITNANSDGNYMTDCAGLDVDNAAGIKATITMASGWENSGAGGGIIFNSDDKNGGTGWEQFEWGITGEGTDAKNTDGVTISGSDGKFTITYQGKKGHLASTSDWNQVLISNWWGSDFTVDSLVALDESGKELGAAGGSSQADDSSSKADDSSSQADDSSSKADDSSSKADDSSSKADDTKKDTQQTTGTNTGDAGVGIAVAGLALAGAAAFAARRKH